MSQKQKWVPLKRANVLGPEPESAIQLMIEKFALTRDDAIKKMHEENAGTEYWINDVYQVQVRRMDQDNVHLNIRRRDGKPIFRDWRHFQQIKNELVGAECEGVELYPAESRLVDSSNKYHLWCVADPKFRFPVGFDFGRSVDDLSLRERGTKQRRF